MHDLFELQIMGGEKKDCPQRRANSADSAASTVFAFALSADDKCRLLASTNQLAQQLLGRIRNALAVVATLGAFNDKANFAAHHFYLRPFNSSTVRCGMTIHFDTNGCAAGGTIQFNGGAHNVYLATRHYRRHRKRSHSGLDPHCTPAVQDGFRTLARERIRKSLRVRQLAISRPVRWAHRTGQFRTLLVRWPTVAVRVRQKLERGASAKSS
jgi:hypothetical protein